MNAPRIFVVVVSGCDEPSMAFVDADAAETVARGIRRRHPEATVEVLDVALIDTSARYN